MQNLTTLATSLFDSITPDLLLLVSGGCHKHHGCCAPVSQQTIVNMPPAPQPQILPQAAPPAPPPDPNAQAAPQFAGPSGPVVSTSVSINGQPVGAQ